MKKNIAFFVFSLEAGGIEKYLLRFLTYFQDKIDATVYCKSGRTGALDEEYRHVGAKIKTFKIGNFNFQNLKALKKELINNEFEAVVDFTNNFAALPLLAAKQAGIQKRIVWYRNADVKFKKTPLRILYNTIVNRVTKKIASDILSNSQSAFNVFYKNYNWQKDNRFEVIYNGIDSEKFLNLKGNLRGELNIPDNAFVVGHVGRYNDQKNHKTAIEVAIQLCKEYNDIYFIFVGRDVDVRLSQQVKKNSLEKKIILFGNRSDIPKVLNTLDCFYFPSTIEGNPNALIEAMITGLPFVASDIEPIKEAVPEELHSLLVPPIDVAVSIKRILQIKNDNELKMTMNCKIWALKKFGADEQFSKFFKKLN